jgi:hypothetical protein
VRARGKRLSMVTNAHRDTFAVKAERTGVDRLVDSVVCSHDLAPSYSKVVDVVDDVQTLDDVRALTVMLVP